MPHKMKGKYGHGVSLIGPVGDIDDDYAGAGRQDMSDGVTVGMDPNSERYGGDSEPAVSFDEHEGIEAGLSRRSPMDYKSASRSSLGVNVKSRGKYHGS